MGIGQRRRRIHGGPDVHLAARVDHRGPDECAPWTGSRTKAGYGTFTSGGRHFYAHRAAYEAAHGPIPEGYDVDHTCHNEDLSCPGGDGCPHRACCNERHLRAVPRKVNAHAGRNGPREFCDRGHAMTEANSYWHPNGKGRSCRACMRDRDRKRGPRPYDPAKRRATYLRKKAREAAA